MAPGHWYIGYNKIIYADMPEQAEVYYKRDVSLLLSKGVGGPDSTWALKNHVSMIARCCMTAEETDIHFNHNPRLDGPSPILESTHDQVTSQTRRRLK